MRFWDFEKNATDRINLLQSVALRYILYCFPDCIVFPALFYSYTLSQISRLIYIQAFGYADIVAKQLQRNNCQ